MTPLLLFIIAALLILIGFLYGMMVAVGNLFGGFLEGLTDHMGPGVRFKNKKDFPFHYVAYGLAVVAIGAAIFLLVQR